jgi:hypothetical protein
LAVSHPCSEAERRDNRPGIAPETPEQNKPKRGEGDEPALNQLKRTFDKLTA